MPVLRLVVRSIGRTLLLLTVVSICSFTQEISGDLRGTVRDTSGASIPQAEVVLLGQTVQPRPHSTDNRGEFHFSALQSGVYELRVRAAGFHTLVRPDIRVGVGAEVFVDVVLQVGAPEEVVEVAEPSQELDLTSSKSEVIITRELVEQLPKSREFYGLISFAPGARQEPLQSVDQGRTGFQIDGASDGENTYLIEGTDTTDIQAGGLGAISQTYNTDFMEELQISSGGIDAQHSGAIGGVINVIQKRGSNSWHGSAFTYFRGDVLNANPSSILRSDPSAAEDESARIAAPAEYYHPIPDSWRSLEPGFTLGGYILKNRLWFFSGYDPILSALTRRVSFINQGDPASNGLHVFRRTQTTHNLQNRLDAAFRSLHVFSSWNYAYSRIVGTSMPSPDSIDGQYNPSAETPLANYNSRAGSTHPNSAWKIGADLQLGRNFTVSGDYGFWFSNRHDFGVPSGLQYSYGTSSLGMEGLDGTQIPSEFQHVRGFSNIPSNRRTQFDAFRRSAMSFNAAHYRHGWGSHVFKFGYGNTRLSNDLRQGYDPARVTLYWGREFYPIGPVGFENCEEVANANASSGLPPICSGNFGFYTIAESQDLGKVHSYSHAFYLQDSWTLRRRLTVNFGVRLEKEDIPAYQTGAPEFHFGFGNKVAPRLGVAWDVLGGGQWKLFGSYGRYFDTMKYEASRSYGSGYVRQCFYTLDSVDYTQIQPGFANQHICPGAGNRPGRFLESFDYRAVVSDPNAPIVDPRLKPMQQHETVLGSELQISSSWLLGTRYVRKRLDYAIEDSGVDTGESLVYFLGNPGYGTIADLLQRPVIDHQVTPPVTYPALCPDCPLQPRAVRNYDGLEIRLFRRPSRRWFTQISYTYGRLLGNYSGLTDTLPTDGGGGRHTPNVEGVFDSPETAFTANGASINGPLPTDRRHTLKLFGFYKIRIWKDEISLGLTQEVLSGTPLSTSWPTAGQTGQFVEGQGNWVEIRRDPSTGDLVGAGILRNWRTPPFAQTDVQLKHELNVSSRHDQVKLEIAITAENVFNQHASMGVDQNPIAFGLALPFTSDFGVDWLRLTKGWDYIGTANTYGAAFDPLYGMADLFQEPRSAYLQVRLIF